MPASGARVGIDGLDDPEQRPEQAVAVGEHARPRLGVALVGHQPRPLAPGGERERIGARAQVVDLVSRARPCSAARRRSAGIGPSVVRSRAIRCLYDPIRPRAAAMTSGGIRNGAVPRSSTRYVPSASRPAITMAVAAIARHRIGQAPRPDRLEVDRCDDRRPGVEPVIERLACALRAAGLVDVRFDAEPLEGLAGPARDPRVLPLVAEPERQDRRVVALELPEDVAGAEAAADGEDRGLGQRLAGQAGDDALVGEDVGERRGLGVEAAAQSVGRRPSGRLDGRAGGDARSRRRRSGIGGRRRSARRSSPCGRARPA